MRAGFGIAACVLAALVSGACGGPGQIDFDPTISYYCGSERLSLPQVLAEPQRFVKAIDRPVRGHGGRHCWFRVHSAVLPAAYNSRTVLLELPTVTAWQIEVYLNNALLARGGTARDFSERTIPHRFPVFPIPTVNGVFPEVLLQIDCSVPDFPLRFWNPAAFHEANQLEYYLLGIFLGVVLIMAAYNLVLGIALKESMYAYYVFYTLSLGSYVMSEDALLQQWLRYQEGHSVYGFVIIMSLLSGSALLFVRSYLELPNAAPNLARAMMGQAILSLTLVPVCGLIWPAQRGLTMNLNGAIVLALVLVAMGRGLRRRQLSAIIIAVAGSVFMIVVAARLLWLAGLPSLPDVMLRHGAKFGAAIELSILSLGLAVRYSRLRDEFARTRIEHAEERERLIGEVHDSIGARLSAALLHTRNDPAQAGLRVILESTLDRARDLTALIQLAGQPGRSLEQEIRALVETYAGLPGMKIDLEFDRELNDLDLKQRIDVSRLVQEWVSNSVRHGGARQFQLQFRARQKKAIVRIASNGRGFVWRSGREYAGPGSGLRGMSGRVARLRGKARSFQLPLYDRNRATKTAQVKRTGVQAAAGGTAFVLMFAHRRERRARSA